jgi:hypothetical protein
MAVPLASLRMAVRQLRQPPGPVGDSEALDACRSFNINYIGAGAVAW